MARIERPGAQAWVPDGEPSVEALRAAAPGCRGCELWEPATQVVFSAGDVRARLALVGEQPGDVEDTTGIPFVGPAGKLLQRALEEAGIGRDEVYVTNAVKHFRFTQRGKRRIHATPELAHIVACRPWLAAELRAVDPEVTVVLGATAAKALLGKEFRVTQQRGEVLVRATTHGERRFVAMVHPPRSCGPRTTRAPRRTAPSSPTSRWSQDCCAAADVPDEAHPGPSARCA